MNKTSKIQAPRWILANLLQFINLCASHWLMTIVSIILWIMLIISQVMLILMTSKAGIKLWSNHCSIGARNWRICLNRSTVQVGWILHSLHLFFWHLTLKHIDMISALALIQSLKFSITTIILKRSANFTRIRYHKWNYNWQSIRQSIQANRLSFKVLMKVSVIEFKSRLARKIFWLRR